MEASNWTWFLQQYEEQHTDAQKGNPIALEEASRQKDETHRLLLDLEELKARTVQQLMDAKSRFEESGYRETKPAPQMSAEFQKFYKVRLFDL